jgi:hypothetical protein
MDNQERKDLRNEQFESRYGELDLCIKCNINGKDKNHNEHSELCSTCRDEQIRFKLSNEIIVFLCILLIVFVSSLYISFGSIQRYNKFVAAEEYKETNHHYYAYQNYLSLIEDYAYSNEIILSTIETALDAQYFGQAGYYYEEYLAGRELNDEEYERANDILDELDLHFGTFNAIDEIITNLEVDANSDTYLSRLQAEIKGLESDKKMDKTLIYYTLANLSSTTSEMKYYLELSMNYNDQFTYPISMYGNVLRRNQEFTKAKEIYEYGLTVNACDSESISGLGKIELLIGDKKKGLELIEQAYSIEPYIAYMPEAYIIALNENGLTDNIAQVRSDAIDAGYIFDNEIDQYLNKEISLWDYYVNKEVE